MPEILIVADDDHLHEEVENILAGAVQGERISFRNLRRGRDVLPSVEDGGEPDLYVVDLQIGSMGGMATTMAIRLEEGADRLIRTPVIMLLDRPADEFLARRSGADAWFVKPLNPVAVRRRATELLLEPPGADDADLLDAQVDTDDLFEEGEWMTGAAEAGEVDPSSVTIDVEA